MADRYVLFPVLAALLIACNVKSPFIDSIDPKIGRMGEAITLRGGNFGAQREESYVTIAGTAPTNSSYVAWQDDLIMVKVPELGESGLVYVNVKGKKSNGVLFSNSTAMPRPVEGENIGFEPQIVSVSPGTGAAGTLITITGNNFGGSRDRGGVFFSWDYESPLLNASAARAPEFIEVSETELGYEFWSAREIRVRVPDGAASGNLEVRTARGKSQPVSFEVSGMPGTRAFLDKRSYTISYSVDVKILEASRPNTLYLWVPQPVNSPSQRNVSLLSRTADPFVENYRGTGLFKLDNLGSGSNTNISLSFRADVYAQKTSLAAQSIRLDNSPATAAYTRSSSLVPSDDPQIKKQADAIIGRERNPYVKARLIYDWFIKEMKITESLPAPAGVAAALEQKQADPYLAALLYCAMARAAGVPCIPTAGVLVNRNRQTIRHYWAEFWINGFGWIPVDIAMAAGAVPESFVVKQDQADFYFGSIDSQRVAFSRGELNLSQMDSRGRLVSHTRSYSLQNIWEEATGGLESYSSLWGDIIITGIYVQ